MTCIRCEEINHLKALLKYVDAWEKENGPRRKKALADADRLLEKMRELKQAVVAVGAILVPDDPSKTGEGPQGAQVCGHTGGLVEFDHQVRNAGRVAFDEHLLYLDRKIGQAS